MRSNDFASEWNKLVVKPFNAEANPQTETQSADGWTVIGSGAAIELEGSKPAVMMLTMFSGFGKTVSVVAVFNNKSYATQIEAFIGSIELDKTTAPSPTIGNTINNNRSNAAPGKFGSMSYTKPAGWSEQQFQDGVVFKPSDLPAGEHLAVQIMSPLNASGTLEQALKQSFDEAAAMYNGTKMYQADGNLIYSPKSRQNIDQFKVVSAAGFKPCR
jgi:hypothetical protein